MPVRSRWEMKGLSEALENIVQAGKDIDAAAERAVQAGGEIVLGSMQADVPVGKAPDDPHPGQLKSFLEVSEPIREGNAVYVDVGIAKGAPAEVHVYGGVQEYGSSSNEPQPYIRPAFDKNKSLVRATMRETLEAEGLL